jgi:uncharacterized membrane-anchored protein
LQPTHAFAHINLAELLLESGEIDAARQEAEIAVRLAPREARARDLLSKAKQSKEN